MYIYNSITHANNNNNNNNLILFLLLLYVWGEEYDAKEKKRLK